MREKGEAKTSRIPVKIESRPILRKPEWIRVKTGSSGRYFEIKKLLRENSLHTVCEEASCPNIGECFGNGTATFMILGDLCTRRCPFCDVAHGKPLPPDEKEPLHLAESISVMKLKYVVITSVDRDDLRDGGASHFVSCIAEVRKASPETKIEILVPDFRGRLDAALEIFEKGLPDVMNHNLETVPRLYKAARPGADYEHSLKLLSEFRKKYPGIPTKSGIMLGLGEEDDEVLEVLKDLRRHEVDMLTLGQYLQPSRGHLPVSRFVSPERFAEFEKEAKKMGFSHAACGPMVRSSYHADLQAHDLVHGK
ncbi:MAG TPA: lipoyl synthase [Burkholderiales bacterium]|nr:lipoyl synthase [Burkholderiales bacterium]